MASSLELVQFVVEQFSNAGQISYKKMFGEYGIYCNEKFFALICDNQLFVKPTPQGEALLPEVYFAPPYSGSKDYLLIEKLEDRELMSQLAFITCQVLPEPKAKKEKKKK